MANGTLQADGTGTIADFNVAPSANSQLFLVINDSTSAVDVTFVPAATVTTDVPSIKIDGKDYAEIRVSNSDSTNSATLSATLASTHMTSSQVGNNVFLVRSGDTGTVAP